MVVAKPDRMLGPRMKVERASTHIEDLEWAIQAFWKTDPYAVIREEDPSTGKLSYRLAVRCPPPVEMSLMVGDAVHNLRSALDLLMWQLVLANGGVPDDQTAFPISRSEKDFAATGLRKAQGAHPDAVKVLAALHPYQGGNDPLWFLHRLTSKTNTTFSSRSGRLTRS